MSNFFISLQMQIELFPFKAFFLFLHSDTFVQSLWCYLFYVTFKSRKAEVMWSKMFCLKIIVKEKFRATLYFLCPKFIVNWTFGMESHRYLHSTLKQIHVFFSNTSVPLKYSSYVPTWIIYKVLLVFDENIFSLHY